MPSTTCGWCGRFANMSEAGAKSVVALGHGAQTVFGSYKCDHCEGLLVAYTRTVGQSFQHVNAADWMHSIGDLLDWVPKQGWYPAFPDAPEAIGEAASEAHACLSIGAARAAVALARAVVEAVAKDQGITSGNLQSKIDQLSERGLIRPVVRDGAHEVRLDGNEVAHGDLVAQPISRDEAADVLVLLDEVLGDVYQTPARIARVRTNRSTRSGGS